MAIRINGDNTTAAPGITSGAGTDTGIEFGTDAVAFVTEGVERGRFGSTELSTQSIDITVNSGNINFTSGFGIDFSDTADGSGTSNRSELFNDYEEGTWTCTLGSGGASITITNTRYVKCGRLCWLTGRLHSLTTPVAGGIYIENLPFATVGSPTWEVTGSCMMDSVNFVDAVPVQVTPYISNAGQMYFYQTYDNAGWDQLLGTEMGTNGSIIFSVCYPTA